MKNKKTIIMIVLILVAYLVISIILFGRDNLLNKIYSMNIMLSNGEKWQLKDGNWSNIDDAAEYNWKKFDVYIDNNLIGNYDLLYNKKWYIYDKERRLVKYEGNILGISGNKRYEVINFQNDVFDKTGENLLRDILMKENIVYSEAVSSSKISLDIDGDNKIEDIYTASNLFSEAIDGTYKYSVIIINDDNIQILYQDYQDETMEFNMCIPKINSIIDIDKDSKYEIITECNYYSMMGSCASLYELKDGKYVLRKGC